MCTCTAARNKWAHLQKLAYIKYEMRYRWFTRNFVDVVFMRALCSHVRILAKFRCCALIKCCSIQVCEICWATCGFFECWISYDARNINFRSAIDSIKPKQMQYDLSTVLAKPIIFKWFDWFWWKWMIWSSSQLKVCEWMLREHTELTEKVMRERNRCRLWKTEINNYVIVLWA